MIYSFMDIDWYKMTMYLFVLKYYPDIEVEYNFFNRTKDINLLEYIDLETLSARIQNYRSMFEWDSSFERQVAFIYNHLPQAGKMFNNSIHFGKHLIDQYSLKTSSVKVFVDRSIIVQKNLTVGSSLQPTDVKEKLHVTVKGKWSEGILFETIIMGIVKQMFAEGYLKKHGKTYQEVLTLEAKPKLEQAIECFQKHPDIRITEFGTRRRLSYQWQLLMNQTLRDNLPTQYLGTSNIYQSYTMGMKPIGSQAHELFMIVAGVNDSTHGERGILDTTHEVLTKWYEFYGNDLSIALSDTFGTNHFLEVFREDELYKKYKGTRQDSGNPYVDGRTKIDFYDSLNENPKNHDLFFSDGLNDHNSILLHETFKDEINTGFGIGTFFSSNTDTIPNPSIVVKAVKANGCDLVKLSDNVEKAIGTPEQIKRYKRIFGYTNEFSETCTY